MRKLISLMLLHTSCFSYAQMIRYVDKPELGIKGGYNINYITNLGSINGENLNGYHIGLFFSKPIAYDNERYRHTLELVFCRQGYSFQTNSSKGRVYLNNISVTLFADMKMIPKVCLELGFPINYLLSVKADSAGTTMSLSKSAVQYFNRFTFTFFTGIVYQPVSNIMLGARYNFAFNNTSKKLSSTEYVPPFLPSPSNGMLKTHWLQFYIALKLKAHK